VYSAGVTVCGELSALLLLLLLRGMMKFQRPYVLLIACEFHCGLLAERVYGVE